VLHRIDPERLQTVQVDLLNIQGGWFDDDLILIVVLKPIGVLPISTIGGAARRFHIGDSPGFRA
jgi:hypothetical protein